MQVLESYHSDFDPVSGAWLICSCGQVATIGAGVLTVSRLYTMSAPADSSLPKTYLGWSIATAIVCFLPLGLITMYYAWCTSQAIAEGDIARARRTSHLARRWLVATVVIGAGLELLIGSLLLLLGAFGH